MLRRVITSITFAMFVGSAAVSGTAAPTHSLFPVNPTPRDLFNVKIFEEALVPMGEPDPADTRDLAHALDAFMASADLENYRPLQNYLDAHKISPWRASLLVNLGFQYRQKGYLSRAQEALEEAWQLSKIAKGNKESGVALRALGELADFHALLGHCERVEFLLQESKGIALNGVVSEKLSWARHSVAKNRANPEGSNRCGPVSLNTLKKFMDGNFSGDKTLASVRATPDGTSLAMNLHWALDAGMPFQMAKRKAGSDLILPSMIHLKCGHFVALLEEQDSKYHLSDATIGSVWLSKKALDDEMSGYALVSTSKLPKGWSPIFESEGRGIWGKCVPSAGGGNPGHTSPGNPSCGGNGSGGNGNGSGGNGNGSGGNGNGSGGPPNSNDPPDPKKPKDPCSKGMPTYFFHTELASLHVVDTPVGYAPPVGMRVDFTVTYNSREASQPQTFDYCNLGPKWIFNWLSCVMDDTTNPNGDVGVCVRGGGWMNFHANGDATFASESQTQATLTKLSSTSYVIRYKDGTQDYYTMPDRSSGTRRIVFTKSVDKTGNAINLTWDAQLRLTGITDSLGQVTTISYGLASDPLKITAVTDPFGRSANFGYDSTGTYLVSIKDVIGMTSTFTYAGPPPVVPGSNSPLAPGGTLTWPSADFMTAMITPYGTWSFYMNETNSQRFLEAADPIGERERLECNYGGNWMSAMSTPLPSEPVPDCPDLPISIGNADNLDYRNSFYWSRRAYANQVADYSQAHIYQWGLSGYDTGTSETNGVMISEKSPLESRVWYVNTGTGNWFDPSPPPPKLPSSTPNVTSAATVNVAKGTNLSTAKRASQLAASQHPLKAAMRDYLSIKSNTSVLTSATSEYVPTLPPNFFGPISLPTRVARLLNDGTSQVYQYAYDLQGNCVQSIDPLGRTRLFVYDANGIDLLEIHNTTGGGDDLLSRRTYNSQHLPLTISNTAGQTTTFTYNTFGEVTSITNPRNEVTSLTYDANGFLQQISGSLPNSTWLFAWDAYGRVKTITGPDGAFVTTGYDNLDRPVTLTYSDGTTEEMRYDKLDLVARKDRLGRWTHMTYNSLRQLKVIQDSLGRITRFDWCGCGMQLEALTDPLGHLTNWWRDLQGRVVGKQLNDGTITTYRYDPVGRLVQRLDAKGQATHYQYFLDNKLAQVSYPNSIKPTPTVAYGYDSAYDRLTSATDGFGTTTYSYFPISTAPTLGAGQVSNIQGPFANSLISYTYDELGRIQTKSINGVPETQIYDSLGRVSTVVNPLGSFQYGYVGGSRKLAKINLPNGQITAFSYYDATQDFRLQGISNQKSDSSIISAFSYTYNFDGAIQALSQQADASAPNVYSYSYDNATQLIGAVLNQGGTTGAQIHQYVYGYDLAGNRTSEQVDSNATESDYNDTNQLIATRSSSASAPMVVQMKSRSNKTSSPASKKKNIGNAKSGTKPSTSVQPSVTAQPKP